MIILSEQLHFLGHFKRIETLHIHNMLAGMFRSLNIAHNETTQKRTAGNEIGLGGG